MTRKLTSDGVGPNTPGGGTSVAILNAELFGGDKGGGRRGGGVVLGMRVAGGRGAVDGRDPEVGGAAKELGSASAAGLGEADVPSVEVDDVGNRRRADRDPAGPNCEVVEKEISFEIGRAHV